MEGLVAILIIIVGFSFYLWIENWVTRQEKKQYDRRNLERMYSNQCNSVQYSKLYKLDQAKQ